MRSRNFIPSKRALRLALIIFLSFAASFLLLSFEAKKIYSDIWQELGLTRDQASDRVRQSFMDGYLHHYGVRNVRQLLNGDKASIARDLLQFTKEQVASESFRKEYEKIRQSARPEEPVITVRGKEEIRKEKIAETEKSIKETETNIKTMGGDMAKVLGPMLDILKKSLKDYKDPNSELVELMYQSEKMQAEQSRRSYESSMESWQQNFPADYRQMIRSRLQTFLELARTVDFKAELKEVNGKKKFVNPAYEGKPYNWKLIFRAGPEVIQPAILFAEKWMKEL